MPVLLSAPPHTHTHRRGRAGSALSPPAGGARCSARAQEPFLPAPPRHLCSRWEALKAARRETRARRAGSSAMATAPLGCHRACAGRERARCPGASAPPLCTGLGKGGAERWHEPGEGEAGEAPPRKVAGVAAPFLGCCSEPLGHPQDLASPGRDPLAKGPDRWPSSSWQALPGIRPKDALSPWS